MKDLVSIVLPTYNGSKYLEQSINSVLNQSYDNLELIIVNDCSKDDTADIAERMAKKDGRIRVIHNKENQKLPRSLNIGFSYAKGEYWTWTSDDNRFHGDALKKMVDILMKKQDIDLVYSDYSIVDMEGNLIQEIKNGEPDEIRFADNIGACFLYRKSLAEKAGEYDPNMFLAEDYEFFLRCYKNGKFYHLNEDLYDYGRHEANLSATRKKEIAGKAFDVMNKHFDFILSKCESQEDRIRFFRSLLELLLDKEKMKQYRKKYYSLDKGFAAYDIKRRIRQKLRVTFRKEE